MRAQIGIGLIGVWVIARIALAGRVPTIAPDFGHGQAFLFLDPTFVAFAGAAYLLLRSDPDPRGVRACVAFVTVAQAGVYAVSALERYYAGFARAWDLASFIQPLWRFTSGLGMQSYLLEDGPLWGDHGYFTFFLFAPLVRIGSDPATALLIVQAVVIAALIPLTYAVGRALELTRAEALLAACVAAALRPLQHAAAFDFHTECLVPGALAAGVLAHLKQRHWLSLACFVVAAATREMGALIAAATALVLFARARDRRTLVSVAVCSGIGVFDMMLLPKLTGWPAYVSTHSPTGLDLEPFAVQAVGLKALATGIIGLLHPIGWFGAGPWHGAALLSHKPSVAGVDFHYGLLWVGSVVLGALFAIRFVHAKRPRWVAGVVAAWSVTTVAVNAQGPVHPIGAATAKAGFDAHRAALLAAVPREQALGVDVCAAPWLMDRNRMRLLCSLDVPHLTRTGEERWDAPDPRALAMDVIVVDELCPAQRACVAEQLRRAQAAGFRVAGRIRAHVILRHP